MKARWVFIAVEVETSEPLRDIKAKAREGIVAGDIKQVQLNAVRKKK